MGVFLYILILTFLNYEGLSLSFNIGDVLSADDTSDDSSSDIDVAAKFREAMISPSYVCEPPKKLLKVEYPEGETVNLGNKFFPHECNQIPTISFKADPDSLYTFIMIDPDGPTYPGDRPAPIAVLHNCVVNMKGNNISTGSEFATSLPISPPPGPLGKNYAHRYVQLVYKQNDIVELDAEDGKTLIKRLSFDLPKFVSKHNLGDPLYGNYFMGYPESNVLL